jgi:hypothetical protein
MKRITIRLRSFAVISLLIICISCNTNGDKVITNCTAIYDVMANKHGKHKEDYIGVIAFDKSTTRFAYVYYDNITYYSLFEFPADYKGYRGARVIASHSDGRNRPIYVAAGYDGNSYWCVGPYGISTFKSKEDLDSASVSLCGRKVILWYDYAPIHHLLNRINCLSINYDEIIKSINTCAAIRKADEIENDSRVRKDRYYYDAGTYQCKRCKLIDYGGTWDYELLIDHANMPIEEISVMWHGSISGPFSYVMPLIYKITRRPNETTISDTVYSLSNYMKLP